MTTSTPTPPAQSKLPMRWLVIFLFSFVAGIVFGVLTFLQAGVPAGLLAGLAAGGATVLGLNGILGD